MVIEIGRDTRSLNPNALAPLVRALGHADFGETLLGTVQQAVGAELLSAFALDDDGQPHYCFARAVDELGNDFAERAAQHYVAGYWHSDPGLEQLRQLQGDSATTVLCQQAWNEIRNPRYRALCYEQPRLVDRVSILAQVGRRRLLFSAYRRAPRGPFTPDEVHQLAAHGEALLALIEKHADLLVHDAARAAPDSVDALAERLVSTFGLLSRRERQVCAGLIMGMTAKDIARTCGIEPSSVVTYKKRALAKLDVPNRHALLNRWRAGVARPMPIPDDR